MSGAGEGIGCAFIILAAGVSLSLLIWGGTFAASLAGCSP